MSFFDHFGNSVGIPKELRSLLSAGAISESEQVKRSGSTPLSLSQESIGGSSLATNTDISIRSRGSKARASLPGRKSSRELSQRSHTLPVPVVSSVVPAEARLHLDGTGIDVAIFGHGFVSHPSLSIRFGDLHGSEIQVHSQTSMVIKLEPPAGLVPEEWPRGVVEVCASYDPSGKFWGPSATFTLLDPVLGPLAPAEGASRQAKVLGLQMQYISRAIQQLQIGMGDVLRRENELNKILQGSYYIPSAGTTAITTTIEPTTTTTTEPKAITTTTAAKMLEKEREIRVFLSSTFIDMQDERDVIAKRLVPKLRWECRDRNVDLTIFDFRWGITDAQSEQGTALLMVLRELNGSDVVVGCLGERYGWCLSEQSGSRPTSKDKTFRQAIDMAKNEFPWVLEYKDRSVTEIEMRLVLEGRGAVPQTSFFFLRDPYYVQKVEKEKQSQFKSEGSVEKGKLDSLKSDIVAASGGKMKGAFKPTQSSSGDGKFHCRTYEHLVQLEEKLSTDLFQYLDAQFPPGAEFEELEQERFRHRSFCRRLLKVYVANESALLMLDKYVANESTMPLSVIGDAGSGKSAFLCNWSDRYAHHHPEDMVITHFIGCTALSTDFAKMMARIMSEVQMRSQEYSIQQPEDTEGTYNWFETMIGTISCRRLIIILDGLDHLTERDNAHDLLWLPMNFPKGMKVIISSTSDSHVCGVCERRGCAQLEIPQLSEGERIAVIRKQLQRHGKRLSDSQEHTIASSSNCGNPRFLTTLLEDISVFGLYQGLDGKIRKDLQAKGVPELLDLVISRIEDDHDDSSMAMGDVLGLLWASRRGLILNTELLPMLDSEGIEEKTCSTLLIAMGDMLSGHGGLLKLANNDIKKAVEIRYLRSPTAQKKLHSIIADHFLKIRDLSDRKIEELPYQLQMAGRDNDLKTLLCELNMFVKLYTPMHKYDLTRYWRFVIGGGGDKTSLESQTGFTRAMTDRIWRGYSDAVADESRFPRDVLRADVYLKIALFMEDMGMFNEAVRMYEDAKHFFEIGAQIIEIANVNCHIARVKLQLARYEEAELLLRGAESKYLKEKGECVELTDVLFLLGKLYLEVNQLQQAEENFQRCLQLRKVLFGEEAPQVGEVLQQLMILFGQMSQLDKAEETGKLALRIIQDEYGLDHANVASVLLALGHIQLLQRNFEATKQSLDRARKIAEEKFGSDHNLTSDVVYELGCYYFIKPEELADKGKEADHAFSTDLAEDYLKRALRIKEANLGSGHPDLSRILCRLGSLYTERTELITAEEYHKKALKIREDSFGPMHARVAQSLRHLLTLYELQEFHEKAIESGERAIRILEQQYGDTTRIRANTHMRVGVLFFTKDDHTSVDGRKHLEKAIEMYKECLGEDHARTKEAKNVLSECVKPKKEEQEDKPMLKPSSRPPPPPPPMPMDMGMVMQSSILARAPIPPPAPIIPPLPSINDDMASLMAEIRLLRSSDDMSSDEDEDDEDDNDDFDLDQLLEFGEEVANAYDFDDMEQVQKMEEETEMSMPASMAYGDGPVQQQMAQIQMPAFPAQGFLQNIPFSQGPPAAAPRKQRAMRKKDKPLPKKPAAQAAPPVKLKKAKKVQARNRDAQGGWWKQNYQADFHIK